MNEISAFWHLIARLQYAGARHVVRVAHEDLMDSLMLVCYADDLGESYGGVEDVWV